MTCSKVAVRTVGIVRRAYGRALGCGGDLATASAGGRWHGLLRRAGRGLAQPPSRTGDGVHPPLQVDGVRRTDGRVSQLQFCSHSHASRPSAVVRARPAVRGRPSAARSGARRPRAFYVGLAVVDRVGAARRECAASGSRRARRCRRSRRRVHDGLPLLRRRVRAADRVEVARRAVPRPFAAAVARRGSYFSLSICSSHAPGAARPRRSRGQVDHVGGRTAQAPPRTAKPQPPVACRYGGRMSSTSSAQNQAHPRPAAQDHHAGRVSKTSPCCAT